MISTLALIAIAVLLGAPVSLGIDRRRPLLARAGESFLYGAGVLWAITMLLDATGAGWSRGVFIGALIVAFLLLLIPLRRSRPLSHASVPLSPVDLVTIVVIGGYVLFATAATPWELDYLTDFGLKGRAFFEYGGIDWAYLRAHEFVRSFHPDYPLLLPMLFTDASILAGEWTDRYAGLINVAFGCAAMLILRGELALELGKRHLASVATLILAPLVLSPWIGMADGPLLSFMLAGVLALRRAVRDNTSLAPGAILLGLGACVKNEGVSMVVAAALAMFAVGGMRKVVRLWPAIAIPLPWLVLRSLAGLSTDLTSGSLPSRILAHLADPQGMLATFARYPIGRLWLWVGILVSVVVCGRRILARDRFAALAVSLQLLFYIGAYFTTPHDLDWHIQWSWERLVSHLAPLAAFVVMTALLELFTAREATTP